MSAEVRVVRGARLAAGDGLTGPHDLHLADGRITDILPSGRSTDSGMAVLEADGRICLPGLVDAHCHAAAAVLDPGVQAALLRQGVTSIVVGQDGIGYAPSDAASYEWTAAYFAGIDGAADGWGPGTMAEWLRRYDGTVPVNVAAMVPHGSLKYLVMRDAQRPATPDERARLTHLLDQALAEGAVGLSTGLEYVPAAWADRAELEALLAVVARRERVHSSHMRGYEAAAPAAMAELAALAQATGVATHVAHYHGDAAVLGPLLDQTAVTFDSYPYLRGCSLLAMVSLPTWLPLSDPSATLALLESDAGVREKVMAHLASIADLWPRATLAWAPGRDPVTGEPLEWAAGLTVPEIAHRWSVPCADAVLRLLTGTTLRATCVFLQPPTNSADSVLALATRPEHSAGSDGIYLPLAGGQPHPRGWGAFAQWLTTMVLEDQAWTWADATAHLSTRTVTRFGLGHRGRLHPGAVADLILVDPDRLAARATYTDPRQLAEGIDDVLVAGIPVLAGGHLTGATPGRGLRWESPR